MPNDIDDPTMIPEPEPPEVPTPPLPMHRHYAAAPGRVIDYVAVGLVDLGDVPAGAEILPFDAAETAWINTVLANRGIPTSLDAAKAAKNAAIDANTNRIRDRDGLAHAGERFAMGEGAMLKWTGLVAAREFLPLPLTILTLDDKPFALANTAALMAFAGAVLGYETAAGSPLTTGRALRQRVEAATTIAEVEAIIDGRE